VSLVQHFAVDMRVLVSKMGESIKAPYSSFLEYCPGSRWSRSQRILAATLGTKLLARRVQERSSSATSFREPIHSTADVRHVPRELEVVAREWESMNVEIVRDSELARMHRDDTVARQ